MEMQLTGKVFDMSGNEWSYVYNEGPQLLRVYKVIRQGREETHVVFFEVNVASSIYAVSPTGFVQTAIELFERGMYRGYGEMERTVRGKIGQWLHEQRLNIWENVV